MKQTSFVALLRARALDQPQQRGFSYLRDGDADAVELTYAELDRRARALGAALQQRRASGARALLLCPPGPEFLVAFFGCLYAGTVAVPLTPPGPTRLSRAMPRLQTIAADAEASLLVTTSTVAAVLERAAAPKFDALARLLIDDVGRDGDDTWRDPAVGRETLAMLQYTSGSTAEPKGVMLTHGNLLDNSELIRGAFEHTPAARGVIWLPPYHDMGLIGGVLQPLYAGFPVTLMSPVAFLQRPYRWLQAISRERGTTSGGPNFAYDLCVRKVSPEQRATLDLSSWDVAFNGAEPVQYETLARFTAAFAPCGFRPQAFYPCYGLAEATLIVSGGRKAAAPVVSTIEGGALERHRVVAAAPGQAGSRTLVGCGHSLGDDRLVIVDPESAVPCESDRVGEIWIGGGAAARGYWNRPEETSRTFRARLAPGGDERPYLRTGDLGFLRDGELFVTGRLKDLIIIAGRNHYPQDIEHTIVRGHSAARPGACAAFSVDVEGEERLVVAIELDPREAPDREGITRAIRRAVADEHDVTVQEVRFVPAGGIPRTPSGKIRRQACRALYRETAKVAVP